MNSIEVLNDLDDGLKRELCFFGFSAVTHPSCSTDVRSLDPVLRAISTPFNCAIFMPSTSQVRSLCPCSLRHPSHIQWPPCLSRYYQKLDGSVGLVKSLGPEQVMVALSLVACLPEAGKPDGPVSPSQSLTYVFCNLVLAPPTKK